MDTLFNRAVESIYDAAPDPSRWPIALQAIADCFDDVGALMVYQREDGGFGAIGSASLRALLDEYVKEFDDQDLRALRAVERGYYLRREGLTDLDVTHPARKAGRAYRRSGQSRRPGSGNGGGGLHHYRLWNASQNTNRLGLYAR
jgi:hypothetical protein